jgi:DNA mismatch endonuclease, patch repair protein
MADVFSKKVRSRVMSTIRSRANQSTELKLAAIFRANRLTGWRRHMPLLGKPDFVFSKQRVAIFVDGCFWHGCPKHGRKPDSNKSYWLPKLERNRARDKQVTKQLRNLGWIVLRIWHHELDNEARVLQRCLSVLRSGLDNPTESPSTQPAASQFAKRCRPAPPTNPPNKRPLRSIAGPHD